MADQFARLLSGVEINQNHPVDTGSTGELNQTFRLPSNFKRGERIPDITGVQVCADITDADSATFDCDLEIYLFGAWQPLGAASVEGAHAEGEYVWVDIYFPQSIPILEDYLHRPFRLRAQSNNPLWYSSETALPDETGPFGGTLRFRLLASTADSGEDFLGNKFRSVVSRNSVHNADTVASEATNSYWLSKPNPSKFAIESLYFDVSGLEGRSTVVDRVLVDPITPGVLFHIYYSDDGEPTIDEVEWENKLWTPVAKSFRAERRQEHAFPEPIKARYLKVEFSHLQAQHYSPGTFHQPTRYKKHPKWVLDYFLARVHAEAITDDPFIARRVGVTFDALDLAYNYYLDDLQQKPMSPEELREVDKGDIFGFFTERTDISDRVDPETLNRIKLTLAPYQQSPGRMSKGLEYILGLYADTPDANYPVERVIRPRADTTEVSSVNRQALIIEQNYPAMFFYLKARHKYREISAAFREDRAYFVGIRELAFTRDQYTTASDSELYIETLADFQNVQRNDFLEDGLPLKQLGRINVTLMQGFHTGAIPSAETIPGPKINMSVPGITSIPSAGAFGTPKITKVLNPTGIASANAFGTVSVGPRIILDSVTPFGTLDTFGTPNIQGALGNIGSGEAFGTPVIIFDKVVSVPSVASAGVMGSPTIVV